MGSRRHLPMIGSQTESADITNTGKPFGTPGYRNYVILSLTLLYTLNFIDRVLIQILAQPVIEEFKLQDWQFGLLAGFAFAFMYTLVGIPIARLSERVNRVRLIAISVIFWSVMTVLCGLAGSFLTLLIFRIGVGIGEAGLTPAANSLIADYFVPRGRPRAMATYAMGIAIGGLLAAAFGGPIAEFFSWRTAFIVLGAPGVVIGLIFLFTVKDPPRGYSDPPGTPKVPVASFVDTFKELAPNRTFWLNMCAAAVVTFVGFGYGSFQAAYFQRAFELPLSAVALQILVPIALSTSVGVYFAGWLTERISTKSPNAIAWIPGWGLLFCIPCYWVGFSSSNLTLAIAAIMLGQFMQAGYLGAQFTIAQGVANARSRAVSVSFLLFFINIIGAGLGPLFVGLLSDFMMNLSLATSPFASELTTSLCKGTSADLVNSLGRQKADACLAASAAGLRNSILVTVNILAAAGILYLVISRRIQHDLFNKVK